MTRQRHPILFPMVLSALFLFACADAPKPQAAKEPPKPPEPVDGQSAAFNAFTAARPWASDAQVLRVSSMAIAEVKSAGGKYGAWQIEFVSPQLRATRSYTYSVVEAEGNIHKGLFKSGDGAFRGGPAPTRPFNIQAVKIGSAKAYEVAVAKSADYIKKNPDKPVIIHLEATNRFPNPAWRVIWGESISKSNYSIFVDATSGEYLQTGR